MATALAQPSVLIVDDEPLVRRTLSRSLSIEGFRCEEASSADQALKRLKSGLAEVVILDIKMPGKTGKEFLPEIKRAFPDTAVIMATADIEPNTIIECMKNGAHDYVTKPFNVDQIINSIKIVLEKRKLELELKKHQLDLEGKVSEQKAKLQTLFSDAVESLVLIIEAKDKYTAGHSRRVTQLAVLIGRAVGLSEDKLEDLSWAALLHDIGKVGIDPSVLNKPDQLTQDEYRYILNHAVIGSDIVQSLVNDNIINIIKHHHDRYDGGAPNQKVCGDKIPLGARILAIADTLDAMTSDRPYRNSLPVEKAIAEIRRCSGTQFDPAIVNAFLKSAIVGVLKK